jgi:hypothetical protein
VAEKIEQLSGENSSESEGEEVTTEEPAIPVPEIFTEVPVAEVVVETAEPVSGAQQDIILEKSYWIQDETTVFAAYIFKNPNPNFIIEEANLDFFLLDSNGAEVGYDWYDFSEIFPDQKFAAVFTYYLSDDQTIVDSISVDWETTMTPLLIDATTPLVVTQTNYWENNGYPMITGSILNESAFIYKNIGINIICYNSAGNIVGGNRAYVDFIPDYGEAGFSTYVETYDDVATTEIYPVISSSTETIEFADQWSKLPVLEENFYQSGYGWMYGGVIIYNDTPNAYESSLFYATFYDPSGRVISSGYDYIDFLFPGDTFGFAPWIYSLPEDTEISHYDIWLLPGEVATDFELSQNPFQVTSLGIVGDYDDTISVTFTNTYSKQVSEVDVFVLLRNSMGTIIGGGYDWTAEPTPAGGSTTAEIWVSYDSSESIDSIEAWIMPSSWTSFE